MKLTHFALVALLLVTLGCGTTKSIEGSVIADKNLEEETSPRDLAQDIQ